MCIIRCCGEDPLFAFRLYFSFSTLFYCANEVMISKCMHNCTLYASAWSYMILSITFPCIWKVLSNIIHTCYQTYTNKQIIAKLVHFNSWLLNWSSLKTENCFWFAIPLYCYKLFLLIAGRIWSSGIDYGWCWWGRSTFGTKFWKTKCQNYHLGCE